MPEPIVRFTPTNLAGFVVTLAATSPARLADELHKVFAGANRYFAGEVAVLDFREVTEWPTHVDWAGIAALMRRIGLQPVGVRGVPEPFHTALARLNLALLDAISPEYGAQPTPHATVAVAPERTALPAATPEATQAAPNDSPRSASRIIDRPVRSGQQIHHPDGDVILMNGVNPGGEVIAGGHIICWGPLSGRAIAGAYGLETARIFAHRFQPELVAIAGIFKTFEQGVPPVLAGKPVQVRLEPTPETAEMRLQFDILEL
ncbi:septum site-determining protein MinC [Hydrogenophilus thiooxidans]|uniref:septum site-determining protein MinC n=1 Tax=Hydrogenophilus thiooxidans TaxID=2820326 RepID=UPI001C22F88E|nr:septum site-determining protein MinC [Hydrogenophilus thiooxidans]